jgi:hypothetical protein
MNGHETRDVDVRWVFRIVPIFIVVGALIQIAVWWMFSYYRTQREREDVRQTLIEATVQPPAGPKLQVNPQEDWQAYRHAQQQILGSYGWASREQSRVRIPIERAMELVVERGTENEKRPTLRRER